MNRSLYHRNSIRGRIVPGLLLILCLFLETRAWACVGIYYASGDLTLAACNLDWPDPVVRIWFLPAGKEGYGVVYVGTDGSPAYGMNEKGLFYQGFMNSYVDASGSAGRPFIVGPVFNRIMRECATLEEVVEMLGRYNLKELERSKLFFGDRSGNSLIAEGDTLVWKQGLYQISRAMITQFSPTEPAYQYGLYRKAEEVVKGKEADEELLREALRNGSDNGAYPTVSSGVFNLREGSVTLYYYQDFKHKYSFRLSDELKKGRHTVEMRDLFPENNRANLHYLSIEQRENAWRSSRKVVEPERSLFPDYAGNYRVLINGVPWDINITTDGERLFYSTSEFGRAELTPTSEKTFFMVDFNGIYDVEFRGKELITRFGDSVYTARRQ